MDPRRRSHPSGDQSVPEAVPRDEAVARNTNRGQLAGEVDPSGGHYELVQYTEAGEPGGDVVVVVEKGTYYTAGKDSGLGGRGGGKRDHSEG